MFLSTILTPSAQEEGTQNGEWPSYGGDLAHTRYSPLDQITGDNFNELTYSSRLVLCLTNIELLTTNDEVLSKLPNHEMHYSSADSVQCDDEEYGNNYSLEFLNSITSVPPVYTCDPFVLSVVDGSLFLSYTGG